MAYDRARAASLLVIDDLGVEKVGAWAAARMTQLIDARVSIRPTIITTNLSAPEVREVSVRIADRLRTFEVVRMIGESKRGRTEGRR